MKLKFRRTCPGRELDAAFTAFEDDEAIGLAQINALLRAYPGDARLHYEVGALLSVGRRYEAAMGAMTRALELAPHFAHARFHLGLLAIGAGRERDAQSILAPLLDLSLDDPLRHLAEGLGHLFANRPAEAAECLRFGLVLQWPDAALGYQVQMLLEEIGAMQVSELGGVSIEAFADRLARARSIH